MRVNLNLIVKSLFFFIILIGAFLTNKTQKDVVAFGCDNYGYLRQAELFRQNGFIKGFDSSVNQEQIKFLITIGKSSGMEPEEWGDSIAPDCHHYVASSGHVINQYPAGTGFLMSLFPEAKSQPYILVLGVFFVALVFIFIISNARFDLFSLLVVLFCIVGFYFYINNPRTYASQSIVFTILFIPILCYVNNRAKNHSNNNVLLLVLSSALCGLLFNIRVANIFIGMMSFCLLFYADLFNFNLKRFFKHSSIWVSVFFVIGIIPYSFYSWTNTGGFLTSTYDSHDLKFNLSNIPQALTYYFTDLYSSFGLCVSIFLTMLIWFNARIVANKHLLMVSFLCGLFFIVNLVFFSIHAIHNNYYTMPVSFMIISTIAVEMTCIGYLKKNPYSIAALSFLTIGLFVNVKPFSPFTYLPSWVNDDAIAWNYFANGTMDYYQGRAGSKLLHSPPAVQDKLVELVKASGKDQFFIDDFDFFKESCDRVANKYGVFPAGFANLMGSRPIWLLKAMNNSDGKGLKSCEPDENIFPVNQMKYVHLNINSIQVLPENLVVDLTLTNQSDWPLFSGSPIHPLRLSWQFSEPTSLANIKQWTTRVEFPKEIFLMNGKSSEFRVVIPYSDKKNKILAISLVEENYAWFHDFGFKPVISKIE